MAHFSTAALNNQTNEELAGVCVDSGGLNDPDSGNAVCRAFDDSFLPSQANGGETDPGDAQYSNTVTATGENTDLGLSVEQTATATCPLCPPHTP